MPEASRDATLDSFGTFGELLKHLRRRARLTLKDLGIALGYSEAHVARLENGERQPDLTTVRSLLVPALGLDKETVLATRLIELAETARGERGAERPAPGASHASPTAPASVAKPQTNLPAQLTRFVGRERELGEIADLLATNRLLTLTGSGGAGKTRLAIEVGASFVGAGRAPAFRDGVWLVEFAALAEDRMVADAVAAAMGLQTMSRTALEVLIHHLSDQDVLLILDNCEHLLQGCAALAMALLRDCPRLQLMATSREPLNIPGEVTWSVPSLGPAEAIELFTERTRAARPDFALTPANTPFVTQICQRLDDMPLALELAAARLRAFSVEQIAARLDDAFRLLTGGSRMALPRQQTLRATIDWSYDLLADEERALLRELSVFTGGWTLEAAEAIHGAGAVEVLEQLVNKSLVIAEDRPAAMRYHLLDTIRQYAVDKLVNAGPDVERQARQRHLEYFAGLEQAARARWVGRPEQSTWLNLLTPEIDNMRAALSWATECSDWQTGMPLIECLFRIWNEPGYAAEISRWIDMLILSNPAASDNCRAKCLLMCGFIEIRRGDIDGCLNWYRQATALAHRIGDDNLILQADVYVGFATPDDAEATNLLNEVVQYSRRIGRLDLTLFAMKLLGQRMFFRGNHDQAIAELERGLALAREHQLTHNMAEILFRMGQVYLDIQDYARARTALEASLPLYVISRGEERTHTLVDLGTVGIYTGDYALARKALSICFQFNLIHDNLERVAQGIVLAAGLAHALGNFDLAARLLGAAAAIRRDHHTHGIYEHELFAEYDRRLPAVRAAVEPAEFDRACAEGKMLTLKEAIALALAV